MEMNIELIKETLNNLTLNGYQFTISGTKADKQICMVKGGKGILLYKGFWQKGQQYHSHPAAFKLAEKINTIYKQKKIMAQVTPALLRPYIIDMAKQINVANKIF